MPKRHTKRRFTRKTKKTRRVIPRRKRTYKGGYDPSSKDNSYYPTRMNGFPVNSSGALPDPSAHGESTKWV
jgi:hypothetical protein